MGVPRCYVEGFTDFRGVCDASRCPDNSSSSPSSLEWLEKRWVGPYEKAQKGEDAEYMSFPDAF